jgi:hypothetical protein
LFSSTMTGTASVAPRRWRCPGAPCLPRRHLLVRPDKANRTCTSSLPG